MAVRKKPKPRKQTKKFRRFERMLERFTREMLLELQDITKKVLLPRIRLLAETQKLKEKEKNIRFDENHGESLETLIDMVEAQFLGRFSRQFIRGNLNQFFGELDLAADQTTTAEFARQNIAVIPSQDTQAVIENAVRASTGKIEDLSRTTIGNIRSIISQGVVSGTRWEEIAKDLERSMTAPTKNNKPTTFKVASGRAKFIARNEVGTALGAVNKERQTASGVELYEWQTSEDERVRPTHNALNGLIFSWEGTVIVNGITYEEAIDPAFSPSGTSPGLPWNCRCVAIPFIPEIEEEGT